MGDVCRCKEKCGKAQEVAARPSVCALVRPCDPPALKALAWPACPRAASNLSDLCLSLSVLSLSSLLAIAHILQGTRRD